ncbi:ANTAR domain-containing protein [Kitasatospora cineracea]|uniref:ANTAR domain-containing protein n=1 Tax=Kitasatospora cineracea TaxID=88074 RepID=UPI0034445153
MDGEQSGLEATVDRLRTELEGLRTAMRTRAVIEQAKGVLVGRLGCTPEQAFEQLVGRSQAENRKLAQLAADLLADAAPPPAARDVQPPPARDVPAAPPVEPPPAAPEREAQVQDPGAGGREEGLATRFHLAAAALATAADPDELAERLYRTALAPLGAGALVLAVREPDGALRLVGAYGVGARQLSQWQRIPPRTRVPLSEAVRTDRPVWVADRREFAARYPDLAGDDLVPGTTVCALPLHARGRLLGALKIGWPQPHRPAPAVEAHLAALADLAADTLLRLPGAPPAETPPAGLDPAGAPWFRAVLDGLLDPVLVLSAVRDRDGKVTDLQVEHANAPTVDLAGRDAAELRGRRLTELYPGMAASGTLDRLCTAAADGIPYRGEAERYVETVAGSARASAMTVCATPFQDGLLLTWRAHDERDRRIAQLAQTARLARVGTWEWHPGERRIACSDDVPQLFGAPADTDRLDPRTDRLDPRTDRLGPRAGLDPRTALGAIAPADRAAVRAAALALLDGRTPVTVDFAVRAADGYRSLRALGEAAVADDGRLLALSGVVQDVTPWRRAEQALSDTRDRLADQRRRTGDEQRAVRALQQALMRAPAGRPVPGRTGRPPAAPLRRAQPLRRHLPARRPPPPLTGPVPGGTGRYRAGGIHAARRACSRPSAVGRQSSVVHGGGRAQQRAQGAQGRPGQRADAVAQAAGSAGEAGGAGGAAARRVRSVHRSPVRGRAGALSPTNTGAPSLKEVSTKAVSTSNSAAATSAAMPRRLLPTRPPAGALPVRGPVYPGRRGPHPPVFRSVPAADGAAVGPAATGSSGGQTSRVPNGSPPSGTGAGAGAGAAGWAGRSSGAVGKRTLRTTWTSSGAYTSGQLSTSGVLSSSSRTPRSAGGIGRYALAESSGTLSSGVSCQPGCCSRVITTGPAGASNRRSVGDGRVSGGVRISTSPAAAVACGVSSSVGSAVTVSVAVDSRSPTVPRQVPDQIAPASSSAADPAAYSSVSACRRAGGRPSAAGPSRARTSS